MTAFGDLFMRASKLMRTRADAAMRAHGVHLGQNLMLAALASEGGLTPGELAGRLGVTTPTIVKMASRLEVTGLVERRRDPHDARLVRLELTERGRSLVAPIEEERRRLHEQAVAGFSADELRQLEAALERIIMNLQEPAPPHNRKLGKSVSSMMPR